MISMSPIQDLESLLMSLEDTGWNRAHKRTTPKESMRPTQNLESLLI